MHACVQYAILHSSYATSIGIFCIKYKHVTLSRDPPDLFFLFLLVMYDIVFSLCSDDDVLIEVAPIIVPHIILIKPVDVFFVFFSWDGLLMVGYCAKYVVL